MAFFVETKIVSVYIVALSRTKHRREEAIISSAFSNICV